MKHSFKKTALLSLVCITFLLFLLSGCKKDKPEPKKNAFKYNSKEALIGYALADNFGETGPGIFGVTFYLLETTLKWPIQNLTDTMGVGDILSFTLLVNDPTNIPTGTYFYNHSDGTIINTLFGSDSYIMVNYDRTAEDCDYYLDISGGKIILTNTGGEYEITLDCKTNYNSTITGYYKGKINNEDVKKGEMSPFKK